MVFLGKFGLDERVWDSELHGGISVLKDNNNLELIFVDDRVQCHSSIIIETFHGQHPYLSICFQNWRLKCIDENNERVFYEDGELCDIPNLQCSGVSNSIATKNRAIFSIKLMSSIRCGRCQRVI
ncbi:phage tail fiber protein [Photorhabdus antumapuensis]